MESTRDKVIPLVEDNADDETLAIRALRKNHIVNEVVVARDGAAALDYLFATGAYAGRDLSVPPQVVLLDHRGTGPGCQLRPGGEQLHPQTGGLQPVQRSRPADWALLAGAQRNAGKKVI